MTNLVSAAGLPKLGKRAPHAPDHPHRRVKLAAVLSSNLPLPPLSCTWALKVTSWELGENDTVGDCACVAPANAIRVWSANVGLMKSIPLDAILAAYKLFGGWDGTPGDASDGGCVISDVLAGWQNKVVGIGGDTIDAFVEVEHADQVQIKRAVAWFGCCVIGLELPIAAQSWSDTWPAVAQFDGDFAPGSWGGHCALIVGYDAAGAWVVTWGRLVFVPWVTLAAYVDEAWAVVSCDFIQTNGLAPSGFDYDRLVANCNAMRDAA